MSVVHNFKIIFSFITLQSDRQMSEREEDILSVVASTWSEGDNAEKTDGCEAVDEMEDMEGDWEVIDEVGDSDGPSQDDPSFEASRLVE